MKFWPQKKWKKIVLTALLVVLAVFIGLFGYLEYSVYQEIQTPTEVLNADGAKTALVIYHPGLTDFSHNITYTYADALTANGWRVEVVTASQQAPTDLSHYSLLTLIWPIYDLNPGPTITNYVQRLGNLNGINTTIISICGGMDPLNAHATMNKIVQDANGTIVQSLTSTRGQHNLAELRQAAAILTP